MAYRVAVVGATGNVGREMLNILSERRFPVSEVIPLASARSVGVEMSFGDKRVKVDQAYVVKTDIPATNGVIHVIDTVLLPKD